jgi:hypothetical protein
VPTPFCHLSIANELLQHPHLAYPAREKLEPEYCAFMFGNTAPDVQVISGQPRQDTHFFTIPITRKTTLAWDLLLTSYPQLTEVNGLQPNQVAFLAGYICHLQADWHWIKKIFSPYFSKSCNWATFRSRLYLHNVLRSYFDIQALQTLPSGMDECFLKVKPEQWLPFTCDEHLQRWSYFLAQQLHPNGKTKTVEVFAEREGLDPNEFNSLLKSEERMEDEIFTHVPRDLFSKYRQELIAINVNFLNNFLT